MTLRKTIVLESTHESKFRELVEDSGFHCIKIVKMGWPDRLIVLRNGYSFYIEFKKDRGRFGKRKGEKYQKYIHDELRLQGVHVYLCDGINQAERILNYELTMSNKNVAKFKEVRV